LNQKELQLQKWALDGILITRVTQDEADEAPWTRFVNRGTVKSCQVPWLYVMIQSTWKDAESLFTTLFGFKPSETHCEMCGPHFSTDTLCELLVYSDPPSDWDAKALCIKEADIKGIIESRYAILPGEDEYAVSNVQMSHDALTCTFEIQPKHKEVTMAKLKALVDTLYPTGLKPSVGDMYTKMSDTYSQLPKSASSADSFWNFAQSPWPWKNSPKFKSMTWAWASETLILEHKTNSNYIEKLMTWDNVEPVGPSGELSLKQKKK
jgi:hypothetical protein